MRYLDHWVNYKQRFILNKKLILPNEIWVSDTLAYTIAKETFQNKLKIKKIKNYYFDKAKKYFKLKKKKTSNNNKKNNILYLCEPIDDHYKKIFYMKKII